MRKTYGYSNTKYSSSSLHGLGINACSETLNIKGQIMFTQHTVNIRTVNGWQVGVESILTADCNLVIRARDQV
jgi:hypothetical protein